MQKLRCTAGRALGESIRREIRVPAVPTGTVVITNRQLPRRLFVPVHTLAELWQPAKPGEAPLYGTGKDDRYFVVFAVLVLTAVRQLLKISALPLLPLSFLSPFSPFGHATAAGAGTSAPSPREP